MGLESHQPNDENATDLSRRDFLKRTALTAGAASILARGSAEVSGQEPQNENLTTVVRVKSEYVFETRGVHEGVLRDLLESVLRRITGAEDVVSAWGKIVEPGQRLALKFNHSGANGLGISDPMLRVLVRTLVAAGHRPGDLVAIEVSPALRRETETLAPRPGWSKETYDFGSGQDQLAAWLANVDGIINVPFLKHHNIAGMTCCLKNLSHALVKHPAQFHGQGCSPYIGDIVALPEIRKKLRVHLVNGVRVVFDGGPEAREDLIWNGNLLLGGFDPVAVDVVGLQILDRVRRGLNLPPIAVSGPPAYLSAAENQGLGTARLNRIEVKKIKL